MKLTTAQAVTANFSSKATGGGGGGGATAALSAIGSPLVRKTSTGWNVILRFRTTVSGVATVRGLRAGRTQVALSLRVAAGRATIGPFPVKLAGFYTFEIRLAGRLLRERACLGTCGRKHRGDPFTLTREAPTVTKTGDIWSVTLHAVSNQISDARIRAFRGSKLLVNQHFLGQATPDEPRAVPARARELHAAPHRRRSVRACAHAHLDRQSRPVGTGFSLSPLSAGSDTTA